MPIPWSRREDFVTILDKLDRVEGGGYCLLYEGRKWTTWQGQGEASTACGKLRHHTEQSTCLIPANACGGIATCQQNERRTRGGTVRNAACCVVTSWTPDPGTIPVGQIFTRRNNCGGEEQDIGEQPAVNNLEKPAVTTLGCSWFGDYSASSAGPYVESLPGPLPVNCHWQPGELLNTMYVRSRGVGLYPYPWGALTGVCSPFSDNARFYYENGEGGFKIPGTVKLLTYVQVCN